MTGVVGGASADSTRDVQLAHRDEIEVRGGPRLTAPRQGAVSPQLLMRNAQLQSARSEFVISKGLKADAAKLTKGTQKMSVEDMIQRMRLEGRLIAEHQAYAESMGSPNDAHITYADLAGVLGLEDTLLKDMDTITKDLKHQLDALLDPTAPDSAAVAQVAMLLRDLLQAQTAAFSAHAANYEEVRRMSPFRFTEEASNEILLGELSFSAYAVQSACVLPDMILGAQRKAEEIANALKRAGHLSEAQPWNVAAKQLNEVREQILPEFRVAIAQAKLSHLVSGLQNTSTSFKNKALAFLGQGLRQMGLSGFALGAARALVLASLESSPTGRWLAASVATAVAHEIGTHLVAPAILEVFGGATTPVNTLSVLPSPNKYVSVGGQARPRTSGELAAADAELGQLRRDHLLSKNANKIGSGTGESKGWSMFAGIQGAVGGITSTMNLTPVQRAGASTLGSLGAGFLMGGIHGADGLNAKMADQYDRALPAHMMKTPSAGSLTQRMSDIGRVAVANLNPTKEKNFTMLANKAAGLATGMAVAKLGDPIIKAVEGSSPPVRAGVTAVVSGMQSILLLNQAWGAFKLSAQVAADRKARVVQRECAQEEGRRGGTPVTPGVFDRSRTVLMNIYAPNRSDDNYAFREGTAGRLAEKISLISQGIGGLPGALINDSLVAVGRPLARKLAGARSPDDSDH